MDQALSFAVTSDGSKTLFNAQIGEHYHSRHGALQESKHVFLETGLKHFLLKGAKRARILEVGFGTGLNFLVSADYCRSNQIILDYCGIEASPLSKDMIVQTDYQQYVSAELWSDFTIKYEASLSSEIGFGAEDRLEISTKKLLDFSTSKTFDVIYFDAFAAVHQPEMWNEASLSHVCKFLVSGGVFVTYAITGNLKRTMKSLGFFVEKVPGALGKREMLRATKL